MNSQPLIIVSNRLPVSKKGESWVRSSGGLVSALSGINRPFHWLGCFPHDSPEEESSIRASLPTNCRPMFLPFKLYDQYYEFANAILWPFLHHVSPPTPTGGDVAAYFEVNTNLVAACRSLYEELSVEGSAPPVVWVHDYHLFPLPLLLRAVLPESTRIGFFLHTPWPALPLVQRLPFSRGFELVRGMLAADEATFHCHQYRIHFLEAAKFLGYKVSASTCVGKSGDVCEAKVFPIGIDPLPFLSAMDSPSTLGRYNNLKGFFKGVRVVVSVARLDPIKGLEQGLLAFGDFLEVVKARTPPDNVLPCFISVVVPSRETVPAYVALKKRVDGLASSINAKYGGLGRPPPISVLYRSISHGELCSLLALGDACMIPSLRDGLNLVASEYIAVQEGVRIKGMRVPGALILSDFTGAASSLSGSLLVNPHDRVSVVAALEAALFSMQPVETESRHSRNASFVLHNTSEYWAKRCLEGLSQQEWTGTTTTATTTTTTGDSGGR